ncbi:MAG: SPOR domain-containing protein [Thermodesulfobacteriota bacterium]
MKYALLIVLGVLLGLGVPLIIKHWGLRPPPGARPPRPNVKISKVRQFGLPIAISVIVCFVLWFALGRLFSTGRKDEAPVKNVVSQNLPAAGGPEAKSQAAAKPENIEAKEKPARRALVADTPMVKAALKSVPVASYVDRVGLEPGRKYSLPAGPAKSPSPPETKTAAKTETQAEAATGVKAKPETKPKPEAKPEVKPKPEAKSEPEAKPKPEVKPKPGSDPAAEEANGAGPVLQYTVHLGSFGDKANADKALAKLKSAGVPAYLSRVELDAKTWHRLMAGRFPNRAKAEAYGKELQQRGLTSDTGPFTVKPIVGAREGG